MPRGVYERKPKGDKTSTQTTKTKTAPVAVQAAPVAGGLDGIKAMFTELITSAFDQALDAAATAAVSKMGTVVANKMQELGQKTATAAGKVIFDASYHQAAPTKVRGKPGPKKGWKKEKHPSESIAQPQQSSGVAMPFNPPVPRQ